MPKSKKQRGRTSGLPANWQWREGRPRWIPSPSLREGGWRGFDLKDASGGWLSQGASIDLAGEINAAVAARRRGELVHPRFAAMAPAGACEAAMAPRAPADRLSIGALMTAWTGDAKARPAVKPAPEFAKKAANTQRFYAGGLKRLVDTLAGYHVLPAKSDARAQAAYEAAVSEIRRASIMALEPEETDEGIIDLLYDAYWKLKASAGDHQASAVLASTSAWLSWVRERKTRTVRNWAMEVSRETPPGRIRVGAWEEIKALVDAADQLGLHSMGDSIIFGLDLSWSQVDRLGLMWSQMDGGRAGTGRRGRIKTGRVGGTPLTFLGLARLAEIEARQAAMPAQPTHVIVCERTGRPWKADHYRHVYADEVRPLAARTVPSVIDFRDADLRDTAFTWIREAGGGDDHTASRTLQSRKHIAQLADAAYGEIGPEIADQAKALLETYLRKKGVAL